MEKRYLTPAAVERTLLSYERKFDLSTAEFYEAHLIDAERVKEIPRRHRHLWASLHRTLERMSGGGDLAGRFEQELEPV